PAAISKRLFDILRGFSADAPRGQMYAKSCCRFRPIWRTFSEAPDCNFDHYPPARDHALSRPYGRSRTLPERRRRVLERAGGAALAGQRPNFHAAIPNVYLDMRLSQTDCGKAGRG